MIGSQFATLLSQDEKRGETPCRALPFSFDAVFLDHCRKRMLLRSIPSFHLTDLELGRAATLGLCLVFDACLFLENCISDVCSMQIASRFPFKTCMTNSLATSAFIHAEHAIESLKIKPKRSFKRWCLITLAGKMDYFGRLQMLLRI